MKIIKENKLVSEIAEDYGVLWPVSIVLKDGALTAAVCEEISDKIDFIDGMTLPPTGMGMNAGVLGSFSK